MHVTADWYDEHTGKGDHFLASVESTVEDIASAPWRWPLVSGVRPSTRRRLMRGYPYSVFYRIDDEGVLIVALAHQSREYLYWLGR
jgi:plasmid stabilization system protein ParE